MKQYYLSAVVTVSAIELEQIVLCAGFRRGGDVQRPLQHLHAHARVGLAKRSLNLRTPTNF
eukprot:46845-Pyramimonas_sp.AAC.2